MNCLGIDHRSDIYHRPDAHAEGESAPQLAIDAVGLAKSFGGQRALTGLDLAVPEGSVTALIGPTGQGSRLSEIDTCLELDLAHIS